MKTLLIGIIVIGLGFFSLVWFKGNSSKDITSADIGNFTAYTKGSPTAKVKITKYFDFQCPACAASAPIVADLMTRYPNDIELTAKHFPLTAIHSSALVSAKASEAAGKQGKFFEMYEKLFAEQRTWSKTSRNQDLFIQYATELGLDIEQFTDDLKDPTIAAKIRSDYAEGVKLQVQGTPTFFINGVKLDDNGQLVSRIEELLK